MVVRVADAAEAALAAVAGVDCVEVMPLGVSADLGLIRSLRDAFPRRLRLNCDGLSLTPELRVAAAALGVDEIGLTLDASPSSIPVVDAERPDGPQLLARLVVAPDTREAIQRVRARVDAVSFEAGRGRRIFDKVGIAQLDDFAASCRAAGLAFGFSGGLEPPDVARLLVLQPDWLGFDEAVRQRHRADAPLSLEALATMRALIPQQDASPDSVGEDLVVDRLFVRDLVLLLSIGAYRAEHGVRQRVRFGIEAEVRRRPTPPEDMSEVFSYDVMIETIRVLSARTHVTFVETLAEEIAAALLTHPELEGIRVTVEKLDVIDGSVGIEITRRRVSRP